VTSRRTINANRRALEQGFRNVQSAMDAIDAAMPEAERAVARRIVTRTQELLNTPGTGRVYRKYFPRRTHRASSPGAPPATDTGRLRRGYRTRGGQVFTDVHYAPFLEFGTRFMRPRPHLRPAVAEIIPHIPSIVSKYARDAVR